MRKDIIHPAVEDIAMAVVKEENSLGNDEWRVYIINLKDKAIKNVIIASKGYGEINNESVKTSVLRHLIEEVPPNSFARVELIIEDVFGLSNEYWVSFYIDKLMYDKKYVFLAESIKEEHFTKIPILGKMGVMIK